MIKRKLKKLLFNPNRFFFDFFAKRLGITKVQEGKSKRNFDEKLKKNNQQNFTFDENVHPWVQLSKYFNLHTGATTGHPDQSLLVNSRDLLDILSYIFCIAQYFKSSVRIYTLGGGVNITVPRETLWRMTVIEEAYKKVQRRPDFVVELIGEFSNNFAAHLFPYDIDIDGIISIRTNRAYIKKSTTEIFRNTYPRVINEFGNWAFGSPWPVDVIYTWVNKDDPSWLDMWRNEFPEKQINNDRFSSKDELRYSLRALSKNMPWVHKIYIVSNCAKPSWLKENSRIKWISHEEIFPNSSNLPVFNSHAIEACLHRIPDLSEHFIYFNDDVFVTQPSTYYDFFDDLGRSVAYLEPYGMVLENNNFDINKDFISASINSQLLIRNTCPFYTATRLHKHTPHALRKSLLREIEKLIFDELNKTRSNKIRSPEDINLTSFFYHHYALATGKAVLGDVESSIIRPSNIDRIDEKNFYTYKFLCFNDGNGSSENERYLNAYKKLMGQIYPLRSEFELEEQFWSRVHISKTIMAYKTRAHRIPLIRKMIGDASVCLDDGSLGLYGNSRRSWQQFNKKYNFHLVIQDDAIVATNFYERLDAVFKAIGPTYERCSYSMYFRLKNNNLSSALTNFDNLAKNAISKGEPFMIDRYLRYGICFMMPSNSISEMIQYADTLNHLGNHDDSRYSHFLSKSNISVVYPLPSLVDQDPNCVSTHSKNKDPAKLQATWFADGANKFSN